MINIIGTFFGTSGYAVHTRNLANAINKITDTRITTSAGPGWERLVNDARLLWQYARGRKTRDR